MKWSEGEEFCGKTGGGSLASVTSMDEVQFLSSLAGSNIVKRVWIGGTDIKEEGVWQWTDGSAWNFDNFRSGQPNNKNGNQHCLTINLGTGKWEDDPCDGKRFVVCKRNRVLV